VLWKQTEGIENLVNSDGRIVSLSKHGRESPQFVTTRTSYILARETS
jgi:hypothetical protein